MPLDLSGVILRAKGSPVAKPKKAVQRYVRKLALPGSALLDRLCRASGQLYSATLVKYWRILRKTGNGKNGRKPVFLSQYGMEKLFPNDPDRVLHSHSCDAVVGNFYAAIKSANERKKKGCKDAKYPRKRKHFFKVTWKSTGIRLRGGNLVLSTGKGLEDLIIPWSHALPMVVEIGWKKTGGYELRAVYEVQPAAALGEGVAGVDLGELRIATVFDGQNATLYSGRLLKSKSRYRAKVIAKLDAKIARTKKGTAHTKPSRRRQKLIKGKRRLVARLENQVSDILHKQTAHLVSTLHHSGVQTVVIGDIRDIRDAIKYGRKANQRLHGWSFGRFRQMVTYKAAQLGMRTVIVDEAYTSQTCPPCTNRYKPSGRSYRCKACGFVSDRDVVGSMNIRAKYLETFGSPVVGVMGPPVQGVRYAHGLSRHLKVHPSRIPRL